MKKKNENIEIHETAFVTSTFRSMNESLSHDFYSKLWKNEKTEIWIQKYLECVSSEEVFTHCLRNRFFLDKIKESIENGSVEVLINFGCGFSMYPFLLEERLIYIEIDKPEIIEYKMSKVKQLQRANVLPYRDIHFLGVDFGKDYVQYVITKINSLKGDKSCFILIEGVLFFLNPKETNTLFYLFNLLQNQGDVIGSASFQKSIKRTKAFEKLLMFFDKNVSQSDKSKYQTIEDKFYRDRAEYQVINRQDYFSLSKTYGHKIKLKKEFILNENFYLLKKI